MIARDLLFAPRPERPIPRSTVEASALLPLLDESELTGMDWQPWRHTLGLLFRSANEDLEGDTLVLVAYGVRGYGFRSERTNPVRQRPGVGNPRAELTHDGEIDLSMGLSSFDDLSVRCQSLVLFSTSMAGQEVAPPDYHRETGVFIDLGQPSWGAEVKVHHAIFAGESLTRLE